MNVLRLLLDPPASGAWNMAVDEALLETVAASGAATLRLYEWEAPTLSIGYFQARHERQLHAASRDCPIVRRASGGGAILHHLELTYSIVVPQRAGRLVAASHLYNLTHETLIQTLAEHGISAAQYGGTPQCPGSGAGSGDGAELEPFLCFLRRTCTDIVIGGVKVVGSAQRRRRGAVLQHGSILLGQSQFAPELPGIEQAAGVRIQAADLARRWPPRLADRLGMRLCPGVSSEREGKRALELCQSRFASTEHLDRR